MRAFMASDTFSAFCEDHDNERTAQTVAAQGYSQKRCFVRLLHNAQIRTLHIVRNVFAVEAEIPSKS